jgi:hypothetical protein
VTAEPVYSPATNPLADAQTQMIVMQNINADRQEAAEMAARDADHGAMGASIAAASAGAEDRGQAEAIAAEAHARADAAFQGVADSVARDPFGSFVPGETARKPHDGYEVTFRISAPERHGSAYGVVRLIVRLPGTPGAKAQSLRMFRLRDLGPDPRKVIVRILDLPAGFAVESHEVHIYADGRELATNLSTSRVELTPDEALAFLILRHAQVNAGATIPASVAVELRDPAPALTANGPSRLVDLVIGEDGVVRDVRFADLDAGRASADLTAAVRGVRFLPALVNGRPVESSGRFTLGELFR